MEEELQKKFDLLLKSFHCPMNWKIPQDPHVSSFTMSEKVQIKLDESEDYGMFKWDKFVYALILCYEFYRKEEYIKALEKLKECERAMSIEDSKGYYEQYYSCTKSAFLHILIACECHILFASENTVALKEMMKEIPNYDDMNVQSKAVLLGLQSSFIMEYQHEGNKKGLKIISKAVELNPKEGQLQFLLARCLQRIRHVEDISALPSERELKALDDAHANTGSPLCLVYMAAALNEASFHVYNTYGTFEKKHFERAKLLYKTAMEEASTSAHILARCAFGFWKLHPTFRDAILAKECFQRALAINPQNKMVNHIAGIMSESYDKDFEKAKEYYHKAGELGAYGAFLNLQRMRLREEEAYDPVSDLEYVLIKFAHEPTRLLQTKIHIGGAYLFVREDLSTALDFWMDVIEKEPNFSMLERYINNVIKPKHVLNIYEVIINETRFAVQENMVTDAKDKLKYQRACEKCISVKPEFEDLLLLPPKSWKQQFHVARKCLDEVYLESTTNSNWRLRGTESGNENHHTRSNTRVDVLNNGKGGGYAGQNANDKGNINTNWRLK